MKYLLAILVCALFASVCLAQTVATTSIAEIASTVRSVMPVDAKLTPEAHRKFWQQLSELSEADRTAFLDGASRLLSNDLARQRAMWLSMRETLIQRRVVVHADYEQANARMRNALSAQGASAERLEAEVRNFKVQLGAIAVGKSISQGDKQVQIDMPLVNRVLAGLDGSYDRVAKLLDKVWRP